MYWSDKQLKQQLTETGVKLAELHPSAEELLPVIDQLEICLSRVEQSPPKSMQIVLYPSQKALIADPLFKHSDVDVKVSVAACISELMRITAPLPPYTDNQMKEVFELIVSTFDNLSDKSSRSFDKRTSILETFAKVRSLVVMLDLECNELIIKMFQLFLKAMRDDLPENIFSCIETIMTLVLEESEDISLELLSLILACVKKDNEEVLPVAQKLGERVLVRYGAKLKPFLLQAVNSSAISLDDYSEVVASICQKVSGAVKQNDDHVSNEQKRDWRSVLRKSNLRQTMLRAGVNELNQERQELADQIISSPFDLPSASKVAEIARRKKARAKKTTVPPSVNDPLAPVEVSPLRIELQPESPVEQTLSPKKNRRVEEPAEAEGHAITLSFPEEASVYSDPSILKGRVDKLLLPNDEARLKEIGVSRSVEQGTSQLFQGFQSFLFLKKEVSTLVDRSKALQSANAKLEAEKVKVEQDAKAAVEDATLRAEEAAGREAEVVKRNTILQVELEQSKAEAAKEKERGDQLYELLEEVAAEAMIKARAELMQQYKDGRIADWKPDEDIALWAEFQEAVEPEAEGAGTS